MTRHHLLIGACAASQSASANGSCQAPVPSFTGVIATDNCTSAASLVITQSPVAGTLVGLGVHVITMTVKDAANNPSTCTTSFTVSDTSNPQITVCPQAQNAAANANCQAPVPNFIPGVTATDNCTLAGSLTITQSPTAGTLVGVGTTGVTITVKDAAK